MTIRTDSGETITGAIYLMDVAPGLFSANASGMGVAAAVVTTAGADGQQTTALTFEIQNGQIVPKPIRLGDGDVFLSLFGTGIRGAAAGSVRAFVNGIEVAVLSAGDQGQFEGLDQINVGPLPAELAGAGEVEVRVEIDGKISNTVTVTID